MSFHQTGHIGRGRRRLSVVLVMIAAAPSVWEQAPKQSVPSPAFDVASVKVASDGELQEDREEIRSSPVGLTTRHASLASCIKWEYRLNDFQISGPAWLTSAKFDISQKLLRQPRKISCG